MALSPAPVGPSRTTQHGRSSILQTFASCRAIPALGRGSSSVPPAIARTGISFGYGHNYRKALGDYVRVAGRIPLPPRFAFGAWWSRYWAYSDQEIEEIIRGFRENDTPLDVFVIDMDWHINNDQLKAMGEVINRQSLGWTGYSWNKLLFPDPTQFLSRLHAYGLKTT
jgi:alpha-glucosidase (family GH31 glycosyl hydrolase)